MLLFQQGIIVDETNQSGDPVIFDLTILFGVLFIASFIFRNIKEESLNFPLFCVIVNNIDYGATRSRFYIVWLTPLV
ncbi:hypothetical protein AAAC51_36235 [Priestia megaterium]